MTKRGETDDYTAADFVDNIEMHLGRKADFIVCNDAPIPGKVLLKYSLESKVALGSLHDSEDPRIVSAPLAIVADGQVYSDPGVLKKTLEGIMRAG